MQFVQLASLPPAAQVVTELVQQVPSSNRARSCELSWESHMPTLLNTCGQTKWRKVFICELSLQRTSKKTKQNGTKQNGTEQNKTLILSTVQKFFCCILYLITLNENTDHLIIF